MTPEPDHPDRVRWNSRYEARPPTFTPHPLADAAARAGFPPGPVLELACGRSGSALELAASGRYVVAVDVSDLALTQLAAEAGRRGLDDRVDCVLADVPTYAPEPGRFGLVLATLFWDEGAFRSGCHAVMPGGLIGWEALSGPLDGCAQPRPWYVEHGGLSARLPEGFEVLREEAHGSARHRTTRILARRSAFPAASPIDRS